MKIDLSAAHYFPLLESIQPCSGTRLDGPCTDDCLGHFSDMPGPAVNTLLLAVPVLPGVKECFRVTSGFMEVRLYETTSAFVDDEDLPPMRVFALTAFDRWCGELTVCLLPSAELRSLRSVVSARTRLSEGIEHVACRRAPSRNLAAPVDGGWGIPPAARRAAHLVTDVGTGAGPAQVASLPSVYRRHLELRAVASREVGT